MWTQPSVARPARRANAAPICLVFDTLGSPRGSGGPYVHALEFITAWVEELPDDRIVLVGPRGFRDAVSAATGSRLRLFRWPNSTAAWRIAGQLLVTPIVVLLNRRARLLVSLPVASPLLWLSAYSVFAHDWRHLSRPEEFGWARRAYRWIWRSSARHADNVFCISEKSLRETSVLLRRAHLYLAKNGGDHPRRWHVSPQKSADKIRVVTFGHRSNKRAHLLVEAAQFVPPDLLSQLSITVLGAEGNERERLRRLAVQAGIESRINLPGFVDDETARQTIADSDLCCLLSSDEGYGLPVAEALYFGTKVLVCEDGGLAEIFGPAIRAAAPDPRAVADAVAAALIEPESTSLGQQQSSWGDTAAIVRSVIFRDEG